MLPLPSFDQILIYVLFADNPDLQSIIGPTILATMGDPFSDANFAASIASKLMGLPDSVREDEFKQYVATSPVFHEATRQEILNNPLAYSAFIWYFIKKNASAQGSEIEGELVGVAEVDEETGWVMVSPLSGSNGTISTFFSVPPTDLTNEPPV